MRLLLVLVLVASSSAAASGEPLCGTFAEVGDDPAPHITASRAVSALHGCASATRALWPVRSRIDASPAGTVLIDLDGNLHLDTRHRVEPDPELSMCGNYFSELFEQDDAFAALRWDLRDGSRTDGPMLVADVLLLMALLAITRVRA